jgi:hypothetical protein
LCLRSVGRLVLVDGMLIGTGVDDCDEDSVFNEGSSLRSKSVLLDSLLIGPIVNGENPRLDSFGSGSIKSFVSKLSIDFEP